MSTEFKRMMELAGLTEIKVNTPKQSIKLNLPVDAMNDDTKIDYQDLEDHYGELIYDLEKLNPQIDADLFHRTHDGLYEDVMDTIYPKGGATISEFYKIYFRWLFMNLVADFENYEDDEVTNRSEQYGGKMDEFVNLAMKGRWLIIPEVTS